MKKATPHDPRQRAVLLARELGLNHVSYMVRESEERPRNVNRRLFETTPFAANVNATQGEPLRWAASTGTNVDEIPDVADYTDDDQPVRPHDLRGAMENGDIEASGAMFRNLGWTIAARREETPGQEEDPLSRTGEASERGDALTEEQVRTLRERGYAYMIGYLQRMREEEPRERTVPGDGLDAYQAHVIDQMEEVSRISDRMREEYEEGVPLAPVTMPAYDPYGAYGVARTPETPFLTPEISVTNRPRERDGPSVSVYPDGHQAPVVSNRIHSLQQQWESVLGATELISPFADVNPLVSDGYRPSGYIDRTTSSHQPWESGFVHVPPSARWMASLRETGRRIDEEEFARRLREQLPSILNSLQERIFTRRQTGEPYGSVLEDTVRSIVIHQAIQRVWGNQTPVVEDTRLLLQPGGGEEEEEIAAVRERARAGMESVARQMTLNRGIQVVWDPDRYGVIIKNTGLTTGEYCGTRMARFLEDMVGFMGPLANEYGQICGPIRFLDDQEEEDGDDQEPESEHGEEFGPHEPPGVAMIRGILRRLGPHAEEYIRICREAIHFRDEPRAEWEEVGDEGERAPMEIEGSDYAWMEQPD